MSVDYFGNRYLPTPIGGPGLNPTAQYLTGKKHYGGGRTMPNIGPVQDKLGYAIRDNEAAAKKNAIQRRLSSQMKGNPMDPNYNGYLPGMGRPK